MRYLRIVLLLVSWNLTACEQHYIGENTGPEIGSTATPTATPTPAGESVKRGSVSKESSGTPRLADAEKIAKILAIILALIAGYYKFLRGRVFHPRLEIRMSSTLLLIAGRCFLKVTADLTNTGASQIPFDGPCGLRIFASGPATRKKADAVLWERIATVKMSDRHHWIEAAELITVNWLIELSRDRPLTAVRAELRVAGKKTSWYADTIAENEPRILSENPKNEEQKKHGNRVRQHGAAEGKGTERGPGDREGDRGTGEPGTDV